jgi:Met-10+ like-protein
MTGGPGPGRTTELAGWLSRATAKLVRLAIIYVPPRRRGLRVADAVERVFGRPQGRLTGRHLSGFVIECDLSDSVQRAIFFTGTFEPETTALIASELRPGDSFLDVGANVGHYSLVAAEWIGHSGSVTAIEASSTTAIQLEETVDRNGLQSIVDVIQLAATDQPGIATLFAGVGTAPRWNTPSRPLRP